jgi:hypothetical protein
MTDVVGSRHQFGLGVVSMSFHLTTADSVAWGDGRGHPCTMPRAVVVALEKDGITKHLLANW